MMQFVDRYGWVVWLGVTLLLAYGWTTGQGTETACWVNDALECVPLPAKS